MNPRLLIKIGGRAFEKEAGFRELAQAIRAVPDIETIIVHGGGPRYRKPCRIRAVRPCLSMASGSPRPKT